MELTISALTDVAPEQAHVLRNGAEQVFRQCVMLDRYPAGNGPEGLVYPFFGYYFGTRPDLFLVAHCRPVSGPAEDVVGYICGVPDTRNHRELYRYASHISVFDDLYDQFPAHFHLNIAPGHRRRGYGTGLVRSMEMRVRTRWAVPGVHLLTGEGSQAVQFYQRHGYSRTVPRDVGDGSRILFMGKTFD